MPDFASYLGQIAESEYGHRRGTSLLQCCSYVVDDASTFEPAKTSMTVQKLFSSTLLHFTPLPCYYQDNTYSYNGTFQADAGFVHCWGHPDPSLRSGVFTKSEFSFSNNFLVRISSLGVVRMELYSLSQILQLSPINTWTSCQFSPHSHVTVETF